MRFVLVKWLENVHSICVNGIECARNVFGCIIEHISSININIELNLKREGYRVRVS